MSYRNTCARLLRAAAVALIVLPAAACNDVVDGLAEPDSSVPVRSPIPERTGPEQPAPPVSKPSIPLPRLPYGPTDNVNLNFTAAGKKCKSVKWLGPAIPPGIEITIDGARVLDSSDAEAESAVFTASLTGCRPRCQHIRGPMPKNSNDSICKVAVTASDHGEGLLVLKGKLTGCPPGKQDECEAYAEQAYRSANPLSIFVTYADNQNYVPPTDDTTTPPTEDPATQPADDTDQRTD